MYFQHIIIDFEMNPVNKRWKSVRKELQREIIEIGAVRLNDRYEIVDRFSCLVKPMFSSEIATHITNLTGITNADVCTADSFACALQKFSEWIGSAKARIYSWSKNDLIQLREECTYKGVDFPGNMRRWMDFQAVYPKVMHLPSDCREMSLRTAIEQNGVEFDVKSAHRALYDAEKTTELLLPILKGEYYEQMELLRQTREKEEAPMGVSIAEMCGGNLAALLSCLALGA